MHNITSQQETTTHLQRVKEINNTVTSVPSPNTKSTAKLIKNWSMANQMLRDASGIYSHNLDAMLTPNGVFKDLAKKPQADKKYSHNIIEGYKRLKRIMLKCKSRKELKEYDHTDCSKIEQLRSKIRGIIKSNSSIVCQAIKVKMSNRGTKSPRYVSPITLSRKDKSPSDQIAISEECKQLDDSLLKKSKKPNKKRNKQKNSIKRNHMIQANTTDQSTILLENYGNRFS